MQVHRRERARCCLARGGGREWERDPEWLKRGIWLCVKSSLCNQAPFKQHFSGVTEVMQECDITNGGRTKNELLSVALSPSNCLLRKHKVNVIIIIVSLFSFRLSTSSAWKLWHFLNVFQRLLNLSCSCVPAQRHAAFRDFSSEEVNTQNC